MNKKKDLGDTLEISQDVKEDIKQAEKDPTYEPITQEGREARARVNQGSGYDDKNLEAQLEKEIAPIKSRLRDQYRDFRAAAGHPLKNQVAPGGGSTGVCVHCDNPVAMGQNYLCLDHCRRG